MKKNGLSALIYGIAVLFLWGCSGSTENEGSTGVVTPLAANGPGSNTPQQILDPATIPQFVDPLVIPPAMPDNGTADQL